MCFEHDESIPIWSRLKSLDSSQDYPQYLRNTKYKFLVYEGSDELVVSGYSDASFSDNKDDFRSQSGFIFCLIGGAVSWKSSMKSTIEESQRMQMLLIHWPSLFHDLSMRVMLQSWPVSILRCDLDFSGRIYVYDMMFILTYIWLCFKINEIVSYLFNYWIIK